MYMFKRSSDGAMIYGDNPNSIYQGALWIKPTSGNNVELRNLDGTIFANEFDITKVKKENGNFYTDIDDFNAVSGSFFFKSVASVSTTGLLIPDPDTSYFFRIKIRGSQFYVDKQLTATGFAGTESTDGGATGDWMTIGGF